jgi:hypothetical protein
VEWLRPGVVKLGAWGGPFIGGREGEGVRWRTPVTLATTAKMAHSCDGMARVEGGDVIARGRRKGQGHKAPSLAREE